MGLDYRVYLGPYIRCETKQVEKTEEYRACHNGECSMVGCQVRDATKFCPGCGYIITFGTRTTADTAICIEEIEELLDERLLSPPGDELSPKMKGEVCHHLFLPNLSSDGVGYLSFDPTEKTLIQPITGTNVLTQIMKFGEYYRECLILLKEQYGGDKVHIEWGLINSIW